MDSTFDKIDKRTPSTGDMRAAAIRYIGIAKKSSGQVRLFLTRDYFDSEQIEATVAGLIEDGYVDDERVGRRILRERQAGKAESRAALCDRMVRQGVAVEIARRLARESSEDVESASGLVRLRFARELAQTGQDETGNKRRLYLKMSRFLRSRGYAQETVRRVLRESMEGMQDDADLLE